MTEKQIEADSDERALYLDYIDKLLDRLRSDQRNSGITKWAIFAGLIYLFWQSIPLIAQTSTQLNSGESVVLFAAHFSVILLAAELAYLGLQSSSPSSPSDFRLPSSQRDHNAGLYTIAMILLWLGVPAALNGYGWLCAPSLSDWHYRYLTLNFWTLSVAATAFLLISVHSDQHFLRRGYPHFLEIPGLGTQGYLVVVRDLIAWSYILTVLIGGLLFTYQLSAHYNIERSQNALILGGNIALSLIGIRLVVRNLSNDQRAQLLARIERDAIMQKLSATQIHARLEGEYLGHQLGAWVTEKIADLRLATEQLRHLNSQTASLVEQLERSDQSIWPRTAESISEKLTEIGRRVDELRNVWTPFSRWIDSALTPPNSDPYTRHLLTSAKVDLTELLDSASSDSKAFVTSIRQHLRAFQTSVSKDAVS